MAGRSHSPGRSEMLPWVMRDFPQWTFLDDPCLTYGNVTDYCKGKEKEFGLENFDDVEIQAEERASKLPSKAIEYTSPVHTLPDIILP